MRRRYTGSAILVSIQGEKGMLIDLTAIARCTNKCCDLMAQLAVLRSLGTACTACRSQHAERFVGVMLNLIAIVRFIGGWGFLTQKLCCGDLLK